MRARRAPAVVLASGWQKIAVERTVTSGSTGLEVYVAASGGKAFFADNISLVKK